MKLNQNINHYFNMKFTEDEINKIEQLNVKCVHSKGGFNGDLHWGFDENKLYVDLFYESRDIDGDWGTSII